MPDGVRYGLLGLLPLASCAAVGCHGNNRASGSGSAPPAQSAPAAVVPATSAVGPRTGTRPVRESGAHVAPVTSEWIAPFDLADAGPAPSGANWGRCALHFKPQGNPKLDAMRLGLLCGPSNGMHEVPSKLQQRDAGVSRLSIGFRASAGDCLRLLVVGAPGAGRIEASLFDAQGKRLATQSGRRRWTMLGLDGPVCVDRAGKYRATVRAEHGPLAVELWRLD